MPKTEVITLPYLPRNWAGGLHASFKRWSALVLHRRAGKTTAILNHHVRAALDNSWEAARLRHLVPTLTDSEVRTLLKGRVYWHVMPSYHQGKVTGAWDKLKEITEKVPGRDKNESEMLVRFPNGNHIQIIGAEKPDSLRGPGLSGLSLDEYSQIPPTAFGEVLSKSLGDHVGYCIFSGTIKGPDQLFQVYEAAKDNDDWFSVWQNVDQSFATETGATITALRRAMEDDRALIKQGLMSQAEYDQEWYLSPEAAIKGSFFGDELRIARDQGRITRVPYDPSMPVDTDWDLGIDAMAIWFSQSERSGAIRLIDYHEHVGGGLPESLKALKGQQANPNNEPAIVAANARRATYTYGKHWGPHDIETTEISSGLTRRQTAASMGLPFEVTPMIGLDEGISAAQMLMSRCWWDETNCKVGLQALRHYRRKYNTRLSVFTSTPEHDGASHGADAFRGLAVRHQTPRERKKGAVRMPAEFAWT